MSNYYYSSSQSSMFLQAETDFGMKMLRQTSINETCVVSPVSVILALATIQIGAKGQTKSQISRAISNDALSLLVSAASFASKWEYSFVKSLNKRGTFYVRESFERKVEYMNVVRENRYYAEDEHMQVLSLHYSDTSYALNIFLPKQRFALEALRTRLTGSVIQTTLSQLKSTYMTISIPKIKVKTELKLKRVLRALGVSEVFSDHCDLSGITKTSAFKISHAAHKAIIETSEGGTTEKENGNYYTPVEYMNVVRENRYYAEDEHMQVLSLRYSDTSYALNIFLPKQKFALEALRTRLTGSVIQTTLSQLKSTYMTISIPKIRVKTELKLKRVLRALGVSEVFSDHCDLSGITKTSAFKISHAAHKAIIEISEGGTTEKEDGNYYKPVIEPTPTYEPTAFIADHPFLFVLTKDYNPLFIGQYV
ncbi:serine proteinase inhibitor [Ancylostoma duodenale]|uniref:Serine proteinase inhibitor n=1 Tax=Ancylostoma duodenale TaxID=51022 RepID=A0A0C2C7K6_9BILA|nr:serine proteinase inhibitor [Ancylostoma duodenale]